MHAMARRLHGPATAAGFGLLMWCGMTTAVLHLRPADTSALQQVQVLGLIIGLVLAFAALGLGRLHQAEASAREAHPQRRVAIGAAASTLVLALGLLALLGTRPDARNTGAIVALGLLLLLMAFSAVALDAGQETGTPAQARPLRMPIRLLFAMSTGLALLYLGMDRLLAAGNDGRLMLATLTGLGAGLAACQGLDWRAQPRANRETGRARVVLLVLLVPVPGVCWVLSTTGWLPAAVLLITAGAALLAAAAVDATLLHGAPTDHARRVPASEGGAAR